MENIIEISRTRVFTLDQARDVLPVMLKITEEASDKVRDLMVSLDLIGDKGSERAKQLESEIDTNILKWQRKVQMLGAWPKGLWLADFDNGEGYYCWKYPERDIRHWHGYKDGFSGRVEIAR